MKEVSGNIEINSYINKKKKKKKIKKNLMASTVIIIAIIIFFTKAPLFNIEDIEFAGTSKIKGDELKDKLKNYIGNNIFSINEDEVKDVLMEDKYIKEINVQKEGINKLLIDIVEESPVFYIKDGESNKIINENFEVLELVEDVSKGNYVEITGMENINKNVGEKITSDSTYIDILKSFYPYIAQNKEKIKIESINIKNFVDLRLKIKNVEVRFGDISDIHEKMENIYRILLSEEINLTSGYIDVSFQGQPVINRKSN